MCGIFGYVGNSQDAPNLVLSGLKRLEYRGYDSWGMVWREQNELKNIKQLGKISAFNEHIECNSSIAIAHSRWATHGGVTVPNTHPHFDTTGKIAVVHNGIIENYQELRQELMAEGVTFTSDTDTETIPHLIYKYLQEKPSLLEAFRAALGRLEGRFSVLVMVYDQNIILAARRGSPLIIGKSEDATFVASDIPAFLPYTNQVMYLDDGEMAVLKEDQVKFYDFQTAQEREKRLISIELTPETAEKGDFDHYMLKEIFEQKETLTRSITQEETEIQTIADALKQSDEIFFVGCGTAGKVAKVATYYLAQLISKKSQFLPASEFSIYQRFITEKSIVVAISQSGETADVLESVQIAKEKEARILSLINVPGSSLQKISDYCLLIKAGPEKAVASTKAATSQMALLLLIIYAMQGELKIGARELLEIAGKSNDMLNPRYVQHIEKLAQHLKDQENIYLIGKGADWPMAEEGAIKIAEVSYIHAEGFAAGELKHGPIALISPGVPVLVLFGENEYERDVLSSAVEVKSRGAYVIGVGPKNNEAFDYWLKTPDGGIAQNILNIIPIQILAYYLAVDKKLDPDMPRNLAKSVTVK